MPNKFILPATTIPPSSTKYKLPYNGVVVPKGGFSFSFASFDRSHKLFNLGDDTEKSGIVSAKWFIDLMDCLKSINKMTSDELKKSMHDLHPVDWENANVSIPEGSSQCEYWQFRINKSKGRVIGVISDGIYYIVWLDPHHNLSNSEGYGVAKRYKPALSLYETQEMTIDQLQKENEYLREEIQAYEALYTEQASV